MKQSILFLPRWYPNKQDIQLGVFIREQAILLKDDFDISVIYVQADPQLSGDFEWVENTASGIREMIVYFKPGRGIFAKISNAKRYKKAQQLAYQKLGQRADLCHVHVPYRSAFLALELHHDKKIPMVITEHWSGHLNGQYQQKNPVDKSLYKKVLSKAAQITCVSSVLQKKFKENTGFDSVVIPNYIRHSGNLPTQADSKTVEILSVGDMADEVKNFSGLIEAFSRALNINPGLRLTLIGGGPDEDKIRSVISALKLDDKVRFRGRLPHEDVLDAMSQCHFYVCNSNFETFGMTVAEALSCGKPVVSTSCGGPEEYLTQANSIKVRVNQPEDLVRALVQMSQTYKNYQPDVLARELLTKFGADPVRKAWVSLYGSVLDQN